MVRITEDLVRKKAEHNEKIIGTLEELSLHQEDVHKIENVQHWCKHLEILYLQSNLIPKIENLHKLKKLKYLNLAINNIEVIENLERCESLEKLDLTLNFIGDLESVQSLKNNIFLRDLYLTGNPCTDYPGYRQYVIATLTQITCLDNVDIVPSERIKALQNFPNAEKQIKRAQEKYYAFRENQRTRLQEQQENDRNLDDDVFWHSKSEHAPETRCEMSRRSRLARGKDKDETEAVKENETKELPIYSKTGKPLNINQAKLSFTFDDSDESKYVLDIAIYKHLDTSYIDVDLQPLYARVTIKGKIFQYALPEEILTDSSTCQRSQITGHLVLIMPKLNYKPKPKKYNTDTTENDNNRCYLEVTPQPDMDFSKIVENYSKRQENIDPDMPPLEFV
ncbi:protein tilB isoform X2 [Atheta coriaria]|uniref:protein tilB isoform X2 n=1 Tax=Dalotia coriaria TaxID=877792 RepID=UPI0031F339A2